MKFKTLILASLAALAGLLPALHVMAQAPAKPAPRPAPAAKQPLQPLRPVAPAAKAPAPAPEGEDLPAVSETASKASYLMGFNIGSGMKQDGMPVDLQSMLKGLQDGLGGVKPQLTPQEMQQVMQAFQKEVAATIGERMKKVGEQNTKEGQAFLAANAKKDGVQATKSGLQYKVLADGTGKSPKATDIVKVHYRGTLLDGTQFDSSYDRGEPGVFPVNKIITGWTEALQMMKVGSKWMLFIPAELAYRAEGRPPAIGPNATLVFEVELLGIEE